MHFISSVHALHIKILDSYWEGEEEGKCWYRDAEGTVVVILGLKQNNSKYRNNIKSFLNDGFTYTLNHYHLLDITGLSTISSVVLNLCLKPGTAA